MSPILERLGPPRRHRRRGRSARHLNVADFPGRTTSGHRLSVVTPDELVLRLLEANADAVVAVVDEQASSLQHPPMTTEELLDGLEQVGLRSGVAAVRARLKP